MIDLSKALDFSALDRAVRGAVGEGTVAGPKIASLLMLVSPPEEPEYWLAFEGKPLATGRRFRVLALKPEVRRLHEEKSGAAVYSELAEVVDVSSPVLADDLSSPGALYLAHAPSDSHASLCLLARLAENSPAPNADWLDKLRLTAEQSAGPAGTLAAAELLRRQMEEMAAVNEAMLRPLVASDKSALFSSLSELLSRHFGFGRVYISLLDAPSNTYRSELHTGFDRAFTPMTLQRDRPSDLLVQAIESGQIRYFGPGGQSAAELRQLSGAERAARAVLIPLGIGSRPLGFIYADRPRMDDVFLLRGALEVFARLASAAVENLALRMTAERRAETDALTHCRNRFFLDRVLEVEIPRVRRYNSPISMLMIDLCDFKKTNDTYGHVFGDHILRETASLIEANVREPDIVVRYGGDEFVVLMVNTNNDQARLVQSRIERAFVERNRTQSDERMMIDISAGLCSADSQTISTLLEDADRSMYYHKTERRKRQLTETLLGLPTGRPEIVDSVISTLLANLNRKEPFNEAHSRRVAYLCLLIARELGLKGRQIHTLVLAALLHDTGKASLPAEILQRAGPLTEAETKAVHGHTVMGGEFFQGIAHLEEARDIIRHHHERFDGVMTGEFPGYPLGLSGESIPLGARILKLADSVDAMLMGRPYRAARGLEEVLEIIRKESGASFDPALARILLHSDRWGYELGSKDALAKLYATVTKEAAEFDTNPGIAEVPAQANL